MALNLITPRYIAPDVTKAAVAGEQIQSSMARTSLAERQLGEQQRKAKVGESLSERQFGLSERELALRAEAQGVSLASQRQAMRHKEEKLPLEIRDMNASLISQQLDNALAEATFDNDVLAKQLENDALAERIATSKADGDTVRLNLLQKQEVRQKEVADKPQYNKIALQIENMSDSLLADFTIPHGLADKWQTRLEDQLAAARSELTHKEYLNERAASEEAQVKEITEYEKNLREKPELFTLLNEPNASFTGYLFRDRDENFNHAGHMMNARLKKTRDTYEKLTDPNKEQFRQMMTDSYVNAVANGTVLPTKPGASFTTDLGSDYNGQLVPSDEGFAKIQILLKQEKAALEASNIQAKKDYGLSLSGWGPEGPKFEFLGETPQEKSKVVMAEIDTLRKAWMESNQSGIDGVPKQPGVAEELEFARRALINHGLSSIPVVNNSTALDLNQPVVPPKNDDLERAETALSPDDFAEAKKHAEQLVALGEWIKAKGGVDKNGKFKVDTDAAWYGGDVNLNQNKDGKWFASGDAGIGGGKWFDDYNSTGAAVKDLLGKLEKSLKGDENVDDFLMKHFATRWGGEKGGRKYRVAMNIPASKLEDAAPATGGPRIPPGYSLIKRPNGEFELQPTP